jgi:hypothetical protein
MSGHREVQTSMDFQSGQAACRSTTDGSGSITMPPRTISFLTNNQRQKVLLVILLLTLLYIQFVVSMIFIVGILFTAGKYILPQHTAYI